MADHDVYVDVTYEISAHELRAMADPTRYLFEVMRDKADALCAESGARLRTDRAPEVIIKEAKHVLGWEMTLVASRWAAVAPGKVARLVR